MDVYNYALFHRPPLAHPSSGLLLLAMSCSKATNPIELGPYTHKLISSDYL